jgi:hypothetical protein
MPKDQIALHEPGLPRQRQYVVMKEIFLDKSDRSSYNGGAEIPERILFRD